VLLSCSTAAAIVDRSCRYCRRGILQYGGSSTARGCALLACCGGVAVVAVLLLSLGLGHRAPPPDSIP
jgi:hypothetical protein